MSRSSRVGDPSITTIGSKGARKYRARWRTPDGASRSQTFDRKVDAERHLTSVEHSKLAGSYIDPAPGRTTLSDYWTVWSTRQPWRDTSRSSITSLVTRHLLPAFGRRELASIRRGDVESWAAQLPLAPRTAGQAVNYLSTMLDSAVSDGLISRNPAHGAKRPRIDERPVVPFTAAEIDALRAESPPWFRVAFTLGMGAGLRQGEACGLTVDRVDFLRRTLTVDRQLVEPIGAEPTFGPPKGRRSYRRVPLADPVVSELALHVEVHGTGRRRVGAALRRRAAGAKPVLRVGVAQAARRGRTSGCEIPRHATHVRVRTAVGRGVGGGRGRVSRAQPGRATGHVCPPHAGGPRQGAVGGRGGVRSFGGVCHRPCHAEVCRQALMLLTCGYVLTRTGRRLMPAMKLLRRRSIGPSMRMSARRGRSSSNSTLTSIRGELGAEAEVRAHQPEGDLRVGGAADVERERVGEDLVVVVGGHEPDEHLVAGADRATAELGVGGRRAPEVHRHRPPAQDLLDRRGHDLGVAGDDGIAERGELVGPLDERLDAGRHRVAGRVVAGGDEQREEVVELVLAEHLAVDLRRQQVGDDVVGRVLATAPAPGPGRSGTARFRPGCGTA